MPNLLSVEEATIALWGAYDDTTRKRLRRFIERDLIKPIKDGSRVWIPVGEVERFAKAGDA